MMQRMMSKGTGASRTILAQVKSVDVLGIASFDKKQFIDRRWSVKSLAWYLKEYETLINSISKLKWGFLLPW